MLNKIKTLLLNILGDIKVFKYPFFIIYDPGSYAIDGSKSRKICGLVRPGDILLRRYKNYLDGYFIPGKYSHSGIYVGRGRVIHAIAEGVSECDILDFVRCDGIMILRPRGYTGSAISMARKLLGKQYDFDFIDNNDRYYCHELVATCYSNLKIEKLVPKWIFGLIKAQPRYLADSLINNVNMKIIAEFD